MIKNIEQIETALGLKQGEFKTFYESTEEKEIPISDLEIVKKSDLSQRIDNISLANYEKKLKEFGRELGLEKTVRDIATFANEYKNKILAENKIEPDKKVQELEKDLGLLRKNLQEKDETINTLNSNYKKEKESILLEKVLMSEIPDKVLLPKEDIFKLANMPNKVYDSITVENGNLLFTKAGEVLKNPSTLNPLTAKEVMPKFVEPYIKPVEGGGGGQDRPGQGKAGTLEAFNKEMESKGLPEGSAAWNTELTNRLREKTIVL